MIDAKEYGVALFMLAEEDNSVDRVGEDVELLLAVLNENPDYTRLLDTPALTKDERLAAIDSSLATVDERVKNLVKIMAEMRCAFLLSKALAGFNEERDRARGIERVEAVTAVPMSSEQIERLEKRLSEKLNKTVIVRNTVDGGILGGMKLRYMGVQLDGSIKTRLDGFAKSLGEIVI